MKKLILFFFIFFTISFALDYKVNADTTTSLIGHWKLDEPKWDEVPGEIIDSAGSNNLTSISKNTHTEPGGVNGRFGYFDGSVDRINIGTGYWNGTDDYTFCTWFRPNTIGGSNQFVAAHPLAGTPGNRMYIYFAANTQNVIFTMGSVTVNVGTVDSGEWAHACLIRGYSQNKAIAYLNGVQVVNQSASYSTSDTTLTIASQNSSGAEYFQGGVDDIRIYNRILSSTDVNELYNFTGIEIVSGINITDNIVGHWEFDEPSYNGTLDEVIDSSGNNNHATASNGATTQAGVSGNAAYFDGTNDFINLGTGFWSGAENRTVCGWIKQVGYTGSAAYALGHNYTSGNGNRLYYVFQSNSDTFLAYSGSSTNNYGDLTLNQWNHICIVKSYHVDGLAFYYLNGVLVNTISAAHETGGTDLVLGALNTTPVETFNGSIDDLRIYNRQLYPSEIETIYSTIASPNVTVHSTCPSSVQARFTIGSLGLRNSGTYSFSTLNNEFQWSVVMNGDVYQIFGGEVTLTKPDNSTIVLTSANGVAIAGGPSYPTGIYTLEARATNGELCDYAEVRIVEDPFTAEIDSTFTNLAPNRRIIVPEGTSAGTTEYVYILDPVLNVYVARTLVDRSTPRDWGNLDVSAVSTGRRVVTNDILDLPGTASGSYTLYTVKGENDRQVLVCPGATTTDDVNQDCTDGVVFQDGQTKQVDFTLSGYGITNVSVTSVVLPDDKAYWQIDGVLGTGALSLTGSTEPLQERMRIVLRDSELSSAVSDVEVWFDTIVNVTDDSRFYLSYNAAFTGGASVTTSDITVTCDSDGNDPLSGTVLSNATVLDSNIGYLEIDTGTSGACSDWIVIDIHGDGGNGLTNPTSPGNYDYTINVDVGNNTEIDFLGSTLAYVQDENDITITANVPPVLDMELYETNVDTLLNGTGANTCELGVLSINTINTCTYDIGTGTNNFGGVSVYITSDGPLRDGSGNTIDACSGTNCDSLGGAGVSVGEEEYGIYISDLGGGEYTAGSSFGTQHQAVPTTETLFASSSTTGSGTTTGSVAQRLEVTHAVGISTATTQGSYSHIVTYTAFTN